MTFDEYCIKLLAKLNVLIAVIESAIRKIERGTSLPGTDNERLKKIITNLRDTLAICTRARESLKTQLTPHNSDMPSEARGLKKKAPKMAPSGAREYVEMSSVEEYRKFQGMPPITAEEINEVDWLDLTMKFGGNDYNGS